MTCSHDCDLDRNPYACGICGQPWPKVQAADHIRQAMAKARACVARAKAADEIDAAEHAAELERINFEAAHPIPNPHQENPHG